MSPLLGSEPRGPTDFRLGLHTGGPDHDTDGEVLRIEKESFPPSVQDKYGFDGSSTPNWSRGGRDIRGPGSLPGKNTRTLLPQITGRLGWVESKTLGRVEVWTSPFDDRSLRTGDDTTGPSISVPKGTLRHLEIRTV